MVAARYVDPSTSTHRNKEKCIKVWWNERESTWEPPSNLRMVDKEFIDKLHNNAGTRIDFDGCWESSKLSLPIIPSDMVYHSEGVKAMTTSKIIQFQTQGRLCALNAIANAITIPTDMYEELKQENPSMEQVVDRVLQAGIAQFPIVRREYGGTLQAKMLEQKSGIFVFRFARHIATWDATSQVILDTDPRNPHPLPINVFLDALKPSEEITKAYEILPSTKDPKTEKKRAKRRESKKRKRLKATSTETTTAPSAGPSKR